MLCAAKELAARRKKIIWISEVIANKWKAPTQELADLEKYYAEKIEGLLAENPDAVFLDDDNLSFMGKLLLEKLYSWYVNNSGKGLFISSNVAISFTDRYGYKLDGQYDYPPFNPYDSAQYLNWEYKADLAGESLRLRRQGQAVGAIVSDSIWKSHEKHIGEVELIPAFNEDELAPLDKSLRETCVMDANAYSKLRPVQQKWLYVCKISGMGIFDTYGNPYVMQERYAVRNASFEKTSCKTIALEVREFYSGAWGKTKIDPRSMQNLVSVVNHAHDEGGKRVILINQTNFSPAGLLLQIKEQLPESERERTWSRLMLLICETEESIFEYQFNKTAPEITAIIPMLFSKIPQISLKIEKMN